MSGNPISCATSIASSTVRTTSPFGTGRPMLPITRLVSSLSCAISTAIELVRSVTVAWMRRRFRPSPSCTSERLLRRRTGMPRRRASSTIADVDGPSRTSRTVAGDRGPSHRVDRLPSMRGADEPRRLVHALDADALLLVGDDHPPHSFVPRRHDAPEADVAPGERLQLERDVLEHVRKPRPLLEPLDEPAGASPAARMLAQCRQRAEQAFGEGRQIGRRQLLQCAEPHVAGDHRREAPVVRSAQRTHASDAQFARIRAECGGRFGKCGRHRRGSVMGGSLPWKARRTPRAGTTVTSRCRCRARLSRVVAVRPRVC